MNSFKWKAFSRKQLQLLSWWTDASPVKDASGIIADGAVRSGKTVAMLCSFVLWAMSSFSGHNFALCGKTVGALRRNVIGVMKQQLDSLGIRYRDRRSENLIIVTYGGTTNNFYLFGGKDEASQDLIQGITLAGVLFDEVALMPESFVNQAGARCSVDGAKKWYNCNPRHPGHYFKINYIDKAEERNLLYLHFLMSDNLTLSEATLNEYKRSFSGVFYDRNIRGLWVAAEGRIYTSFTEANIYSKEKFKSVDEYGLHTCPLYKNIIDVTMGVDFGGNHSAHAFQLTGVTKNFKEIITLKEKRIVESKEGLTPEQLEKNFVQFVKECRQEYPKLSCIYCDSAEQVLIRGFRAALAKEGIAIPVRDAYKGAVIDRIDLYMMLQGQGRYLILDDCKETIQAFKEALWDSKHADTRLDDGTTNIDTLDAQEYSTEKYTRALINARLT